MTDQSLEQMENHVERQLSYLEPIHYDNNDIFGISSMESNNNDNYRKSTPSNDGFPPTPPQTQRRGRRSRKSEREEEERAARNLMMISSSPRRVPKHLKRPHHQHVPLSSNKDDISTSSPTLPSFQDIVSRVPDYDQQSRQFAESFQHASPPVGALPIDPGSIGTTRFPYFPPVNWTGALSPIVDNSYPPSTSRTPTSPGYRYHAAAKNSRLH